MQNAYPSFLESEYAPKPPSQAFFHCIPVPLEQSVSYGRGTSLGPSAILQASAQLEAWENFLTPGKMGVYTAEPVDCTQSIVSILQRIEDKVEQTLACHGLPFLLGGEHTITLGALAAFCKRKIPLGIVQIDAHADLRSSYEGSIYSHACVMFRACSDYSMPLVQLGIREYSAEEVVQQQVFHVTAYPAWEFFEQGLPKKLLPDSFPENVYVSFDVDGLDASLMPATGTPSPGGFFYQDVCRILKQVASERHIVGFDVVELAPMAGLHSCDFTAAKIVHLLMALCLPKEGVSFQF